MQNEVEKYIKKTYDAIKSKNYYNSSSKLSYSDREILLENYIDIKDDYYIHRDILDLDDDTYLYLIKYINENNIKYKDFILTYKAIYKIVVSDRNNKEEYNLFLKLIPYINSNLINSETFEILYSLVEDKKNLVYLCKRITDIYGDTTIYGEYISDITRKLPRLIIIKEELNNFLKLIKEYRKYCIDDNVFMSTVIKSFNSALSYNVEKDIEILKNKNQDKDIYELNKVAEELNKKYQNTKNKLKENIIDVEKQKNKIEQKIEKRSSIINDYINDKINPFNEQLEKIENDFFINNDDINKEIENRTTNYSDIIDNKKAISKNNIHDYASNVVSSMDAYCATCVKNSKYTIEHRNKVKDQIIKEIENELINQNKKALDTDRNRFYLLRYYTLLNNTLDLFEYVIDNSKEHVHDCLLFVSNVYVGRFDRDAYKRILKEDFAIFLKYYGPYKVSNTLGKLTKIHPYVDINKYISIIDQLENLCDALGYEPLAYAKEEEINLIKKLLDKGFNITDIKTILENDKANVKKVIEDISTKSAAILKSAIYSEFSKCTKTNEIERLIEYIDNNSEGLRHQDRLQYSFLNADIEELETIIYTLAANYEDNYICYELLVMLGIFGNDLKIFNTVNEYMEYNKKTQKEIIISYSNHRYELAHLLNKDKYTMTLNEFLSLSDKDKKEIFKNINYDGKYLSFMNENGVKVLTKKAKKNYEKDKDFVSKYYS